MWTGLSYSTVKGKFAWCGKSISPFRKWCAGEPNIDTARNQTCVAIRIKSGEAVGCLKVMDCGLKLTYICHVRCIAFDTMRIELEAVEDMVSNVNSQCHSCMKKNI